jgi:hypothetical protein
LDIDQVLAPKELAGLEALADEPEGVHGRPCQRRAQEIRRPWCLAAGPAASPELSDAEFFRFCRLVHRHAGIHLTAQKKEMVRARLMKMLRARGLSSFQEYYELVLADKSGAELAGFWTPSPPT